jgi:hypothetical protein
MAPRSVADTETTGPVKRSRRRRALDAIDERMGIKALEYPVPEHANNLGWSLGGLTVFTFVVLLVTGIYIAVLQPDAGVGEPVGSRNYDQCLARWIRPRYSLLGCSSAQGVLPRLLQAAA